MTLAIVAGLTFTKKSRPASIGFDLSSSTASMRVARTKAPRTPVASQAVSRLKPLITSRVNGHFLVLRCLARGRGLCIQGIPLEKWSGLHKLLVTPIGGLNRRLEVLADFSMDE